MADCSKQSTVEYDESYIPDDASVPSSSSYIRNSLEEDDRSDYITQRTRRSLIGRTMLGLGFKSTSPRRAEYDYFSAQREDSMNGAWSSKRSPTREHRRCGRSRVLNPTKRASILILAVVLMSFGVLHILQTVLGRARLFWELDSSDGLFADWDRPGHPGELLAHYPTDATRDVLPIAVHSHNDYWRKIPLFDALHWGCTSVEADVWNFDDELYVGHSIGSLTRERSFRKLYVDPLVELLDAMNRGSEFSNETARQVGVFDRSPEQTLVLLVDLKTSGKDTFPLVERQLQALREKDYLTYWNGEAVVSRAVTVVATGNAPWDSIVSNSTYRDIFFDAPLDKLWVAPQNPNEVDSETQNIPSPSSVRTGRTFATRSTNAQFDSTNSYYASVSFRQTAGLTWHSLTKQQMEIIRGQIRGAHQRGLKVRYWETPSWPISLRNHVWHVLMREGADVLNADDLRGAAKEDWKARMHRTWK